MDALHIGREYRSERITSRVRTFRASLPYRSKEVAALDEALISLYQEDV
ncbi:MAG: hypothetical protein JO100_05425 [Pseudonocardia sp.]|nr:hypothetical protein [Pseudonocardia sp.]